MIVLDTHAWLWWLHDPKQLSSSAQRSVASQARRKDGLLVSVISVWEVALKTQMGKLSLPIELDAWFARAKVYPGVTIVAIEADDAIESTRLPGQFHRDPADRMIVALARRLGAPIVTRDEAMRAYPHVQTIW